MYLCEILFCKNMKNIKSFLLSAGLFLGSLFCLISCQNSAKTEPLAFGYEFFPLEIGGYVIYEVEKINYPSNQPIIRKNYQLKEEVVDTFTSASKVKLYVLERYVRIDETKNWEIDSVWAASRTNNQAIRQENNISFVRLSFPLKDKLIWNGNFFNSNPREDYQIEDFNKSLVINKLNMPKTLKVQQINDSSLVRLTRRSEIYAENIGIVSIDETQVSYKSDNASIGKGIIDFGKIIKQRIIAYGKK